ncbi:MAG: phage portal protein [Planctomycetes bacterium]|nr:phage portal protein [Planctomycetota bacterium]
MSWLLGPKHSRPETVDRTSRAFAAPAAHSDFWYEQSAHGTQAGIGVSSDSAMRISAVQSCIRLIARCKAMLPKFIYERVGKEGKQRASSHPLYDVMHDQPNRRQTAYERDEMQTAHLLLRGNAVDEVIAGPRGFADQLEPIHPDHVNIDITRETRRRVYDVSSNHDGKARVLTQDEVHHVHLLSLDGVKGASIIGLAREGIALSQALEVHASRFFGAGARPGGVLTAEGKLAEPSRTRNETAWNEAFGGAYNSHKTVQLEGGVKWQAMTVTNEDSQFLESRSFQVIDICRIFGVPPHMVAAQEKSTAWGTGIEQLSLGFVVYTLAPLLVCTEQAVKRDLILNPRKFFFEYLVDGLLRGDSKTRWDNYKTAIMHGVFSPDEARRRENMNPRSDGLGGRYWRPSNIQVDSDTPTVPSAGGNGEASIADGSDLSAELDRHRNGETHA